MPLENWYNTPPRAVIPQDVLADIVDWWDTIAALGEAAGRQMAFARGYEPSWLAKAREFATKR